MRKTYTYKGNKLTICLKCLKLYLIHYVEGNFKFLLLIKCIKIYRIGLTGKLVKQLNVAKGMHTHTQHINLFRQFPAEMINTVALALS